MWVGTALDKWRNIACKGRSLYANVSLCPCKELWSPESLPCITLTNCLLSLINTVAFLSQPSKFTFEPPGLRFDYFPLRSCDCILHQCCWNHKKALPQLLFLFCWSRWFRAFSRISVVCLCSGLTPGHSPRFCRSVHPRTAGISQTAPWWFCRPAHIVPEVNTTTKPALLAARCMKHKSPRGLWQREAPGMNLPWFEPAKASGFSCFGLSRRLRNLEWSSGKKKAHTPAQFSSDLYSQTTMTWRKRRRRIISPDSSGGSRCNQWHTGLQSDHSQHYSDSSQTKKKKQVKITSAWGQFSVINHAVRRVEEGMLLFLNDRLSNTVIILYFWYLLSCITKKKHTHLVQAGLKLHFQFLNF